MKPFIRGILLLGVLSGCLCTACSGDTQTSETVANSTSIAATIIESAVSTPAIEPTSTPLPITPTIPTPSATKLPTNTPVTEPSPTSSPTATPCPPDQCVYPGQFFLERPIPETGNTAVDVTYRFGSTQAGKRDPHHGVEFLNGFGTPVLAAGNGTVVVAGTDIEPISEPGAWPLEYYGPYSNFYGNLVVVEHQVPQEIRNLIPDYAPVVYTLYGHLSEILVEEGQQVQTGQEIGKIGVTGVSIGSHLHFEVREGQNKYAHSRNPEMWLASHQGEDGSLNGGFAGRVIDPYGDNVPVSNIVLEYLPQGSDGGTESEFYLLSYEEQDLIDQPPFHESFAIGDIPPGKYRISFPLFGRQEFLIEVLPGELTLLTFKIEG